jgi:hypothetical protein
MDREQLRVDWLTNEQKSTVLKAVGRVKMEAKTSGRMQFVLIAFEGDKMFLSTSDRMVEINNQ